MTRSIHDLRETLDLESTAAPLNTERIAEVETRIRRRRKRRVTTGAVLGVAAAALTVTGVLVLPGAKEETPQALDGPGHPQRSQEIRTPPTVYQGMRRIAMRRFTTTGKMMRVNFTPVGPDTAYVIQCRPGYEVIEQTDGDGGYGSFGDCDSDLDPPQSVSTSDQASGPLKEGVAHVLEVVVLPKGTVKDNVIEYMNEDAERIEGGSTGQISLSEYLASHEPGTSPWTVSVYSGTCKGDC
ncbi:hypothetical protein ACGFNU_40615 [Spirillospora sp. NPDC048911]|uniref:hypothetical protein n=1 Tax=Spirillospora sp. NPDC048911 TaxID=3364527 RepID=UPI00371C240F